MGDIDRSSPSDGQYDHTKASTGPSDAPKTFADKLRSLINISPAPKEPVSAAPGYEGKTPAQIADEQAR